MSTPSVDILNKYAGLGDAVNQARADRETLLEKIQSSHAVQAQLLQQERHMQIATAKEKGSIAGWKSKLETLEKEYRGIQLQLNQAKWRNDRAQQALQALKFNCPEQKRVFLEESLLFRQDCKRMRLAASAAGLDYAATQAFVAVNGGDTSAFQNDAAAAEITRDGESDDADDPTSWRVEDTDDELKQFLVVYYNEALKLKDAQTALADALTKKETVTSRAVARQEQQKQLQTQLHRIDKDNQDLVIQLEDTNRRIEEARHLAVTFEKNARARAATSRLNTSRSVNLVTPSTVPSIINDHGNQNQQQIRSAHNPYARITNNHNTSMNSEEIDTKACAANTNVVSVSHKSKLNVTIKQRPCLKTTPATKSFSPVVSQSTTLLQRQHPHRDGGRIRRDRQFGTELSVLGSDDFLSGNMSPHRQSNKGDTNFETPENGLGVMVNAHAIQNGLSVREASLTNLHHDDFVDILNDDDDDDDDDILTFVAFPKSC